MRLLPLAAAAVLLAALPAAEAALWLPSASDSSAPLRAVDFLTPTDGLAVGGGKEILRTLDGGFTWTEVLGGFFDTGWFDVAFADPVRAYAVGQNAIFQPNVAISDDGGVSWSQVVFYFRDQGVGYEGALRAVAVTDSAVVAAGAIWDGRGAVVRSTDGGLTWSTVHITPEALVAADAADGVVVVAGTFGSLHRSTDGGLTWTRVSVPTFETIWSVDLLADGLGYAAGENSAVLKTTDGGRSWTALTVAVPGDFHGIAFATPTLGYVVGDGGTALRTLDGGVTWTPEVTGTTTNLLDAAAVGAGPLARAWAVGEGGTILQAVDLAL